MEEDAFFDEPAELEEQNSLKTYFNSLPYKCESVEEMKEKLEQIVGKLYICAKARNWIQLTSWDGLLQCWLLMRYPIAKTTRAKLVRFYYELSLLPGVEPRLIRSWTDMVSRLLSNKPGQKRKLEATDLQLPWKPLWRGLQKELWPKSRTEESNRNVINILLYLADHCRRYFPAQEIPDMLDILIPMITPETILTMIPVVLSFVPPTHTHLYLPFLLRLWEAFNSSILDDRLLDLAGNLSQEHVSGPYGTAGTEGGAQWKDVGIWSNAEWGFLVSKGLTSMNVPVGTSKGASNTSVHADAMADRKSLRIKKTLNRPLSLARIFAYSMYLDGPIRSSPTATPGQSVESYLAGSKALDSLERLLTSTESFFHPSNSGHWSQPLTLFLQHLTTEFCRRVKEEEKDDCKTPMDRRLTPGIRRAFVSVLRTPALLAMFSKDSTSMGYALTAIRSMSIIEPNLLMPELLERAYSGLEVVNETHRTTSVLSMLLGISRPLVTEKIWPGGQKHVIPLLELCIPGIDLNDPEKTVCTTTFILNIVQHIKLADLSSQQSGAAFTEDAPISEAMDVDGIEFPQGTELGMPTLSLGEERTLVRESTSALADWVTSLFRRVIALYENLPEEGGKKNTTGGKQEENVLKSIKSMMDIVCLHLSDSLFDLVLKLTYDYATTNAKSNAVKAFGQLVACLARANPEKTISKFLPFCIGQIEEELKHGASSIRTTASHAAVPSDTTLHWNMAILRGCFGHGSSALLKHKQQILHVLQLLIEKTKTERGYSGTGRLLTRVLHTLAGVYPLHNRFVNTNEWHDENFDRDHNLHWGKFYEPQDVTIDWHVPTDEEIVLIMQILDDILAPSLDKVEALLTTTQNWDSADRNDFCRYLTVCRAVWAGLPTFIQEGQKTVVNASLNMDLECADLMVSHIPVDAGFTLTQPQDARYQRAEAHRIRFGELVFRAAFALRNNTRNEDHIDAVIGVLKAIDIYLLDYAMGKTSFESLQKNYTQARDLNRVWSQQKDNSRLVLIKRAQVYHSARVYMHALYRQRSALDDRLLTELVELSLSPYTRVRRHSQSILKSVYSYYVRSTRSTLSSLFGALAKGNDSDRMKGALYILGDKGIASYALTDHTYHGQYLLSLLECQHEEKPSVQKLVATFSQDCLTHMVEEAVHTDGYALETPQIEQALQELAAEFRPSFVNQQLLIEACNKAPVRAKSRRTIHEKTVASILQVAARPSTHWRYVQMATRFLSNLLRRDAPISPHLAKFFLEHTISPQPTIRLYAQRAFTKLMVFIKMRTYAKSGEELWLEEWRNPLGTKVPITDPAAFLQSFERPIDSVNGDCYVDKFRTGFLTWTPYVDGYQLVSGDSSITWETSSQECLEEMCRLVTEDDYLQKLAAFWSQESNKSSNSIDLRSDNVAFIKTLSKMFEARIFDPLTKIMDPLLSDTDKFKQRALGEFLAGLLRGAKHWPASSSGILWKWATTRLDLLFNQIKPETLVFWGTVFTYILDSRDPRRHKPMVDWIMAVPLDLQGDSAFAMTKGLLCIEVLVECFGTRFSGLVDHYVKLMFDNLGTSYAELRLHVVQLVIGCIGHQWAPSYESTYAFLQACREHNDPLHIRHAKYDERMQQLVAKMAKWKAERLPPPRVNQSEYDKTGLTLLLMLWFVAHNSRASLMFPYAVPLMPEIFRMTELNDNSELHSYSSAVLYSLSAVTPPAGYVAPILENFVVAIKESTSWRLRLNALPALVVFFYRNLLLVPPEGVTKVMDVLLDCLSDENVEVREMASKMLSGVIRSSQRQRITSLKDRFVALARKTPLPQRNDPTYETKLRVLHSSILGLCALIESFPYSVERWMPPLTEVLALHATDPPPISTTIRKCASEFKKTHQDTWHKDQHAFDEDQLQNLSTMLVGTSYYA